MGHRQSIRGALSPAIALACGVWVALAASAAAAVTAAEVVQRVQERLSAQRTFAARFEKQFLWAALDRTATRRGHLYLQRPDRFRVETDDGTVVVADGTAIWSYSERNSQVVVSPYAGEFQTPWEVFLDYSSQYVPVALEEVRLGRDRCYLVVLQPQSEAAEVTQMRIWVDAKHWYPHRVEQLEDSGNLTTYLLSDVETNGKLDAGLFAFAPPAGTEVIDRRTPPAVQE